MMGLGESGAGGGGAGVVGAEGIGGGVSAMTSVPPDVLRAANSSRYSLRNLVNLSRQASICFELFSKTNLASRSLYELNDPLNRDVSSPGFWIPGY